MKILPLNYIVLLFVCLAFFVQSTIAQNLLANGGFEEINTCLEMDAKCSPVAWFIVAPGNLGMPPKEGAHSLWFSFNNTVTPLQKTYPYTKLLCPLKTGNEYTLQLWLNTGKHKFSHFDVLFSSKDPSRPNTSNSIIEPTFQFDNSNTIQNESNGWMLLSKQFTAQEDHSYMLFGNLQNNLDYAGSKKSKTEREGNIIYHIDDISLTAKDSTLNQCPKYEENKKQLYAERHRHTSYVYLDEKRAPLVRTRSSVPSPTPSPALKTDTLVIPGVLFATNSSVIDTGCRTLLDDFIAKIKDRDIRSINVHGHTDNTGKPEFNKNLSLQRATAVGEYLTSRLNKLKSIMIENGYGDSRPVAPNNSEANKASNRRVEIILGYSSE
jgi:outer membrane protein OmpA-like peptidoglycan-associated protein